MDGENQQSRDVTAARPNPSSRWVCGFQHLGCACPDGPSPNGKCNWKAPANNAQAAECGAECELAAACQKSGSCTTNGCGSTESAAQETIGPDGPCIPQASFWFSRQVIALNAAILVGGILLLCMALPQRESVFVPGGLSNKHAQILGNKLVSERCSLCHPNSHADDPLASIQDDLCMKCHESHMPDAAMRSPHDLNAQQLASILDHSQRAKLISHTAFAGKDDDESTADIDPIQVLAGMDKTNCASCHIEHHGAGHDLKAITNRRCQACHEKQFSSFAMGHPQFDHYPYRTKRHIAFDHAQHEKTYFGQKNETFDCSRCHVDESKASTVGSVFRSVGFEQACASCHSEPINASAVNGWAILQLPAILPEDAESAELGLSDWPEAAQFDYDGEVTLAAQLLLASDEEVSASLGEVPASGKLSDIAAADRPRVTREIAKGFRRFVTDIALHGQAAWKRRIVQAGEQTLDRKLTERELHLVDEMSAGLPPDLFRAMEQHWFRNAPNLAATEDGQVIRFASQRSQSDDLLLEEDDDLLLGGNSDADLSKPPRAKLVLDSLQASQHVAEGGWYLDQDIMAVRYVPRGHADRTLAAWAEFAVLLASAPVKDAKPKQWHQPDLALGSIVPGGCTECHVLDVNSSSTVTWSNWKTNVRPRSAKLFTKFDHTPHLTLPTVNDCRYCHVLDQTVGRDTVVSLLKPGKDEPGSSQNHRLVSTQTKLNDLLRTEFVSMKRSQCAACHRPGGANDGCTQCHNYHVGAEGFRWSHAWDDSGSNQVD